MSSPAHLLRLRLICMYLFMRCGSFCTAVTGRHVAVATPRHQTTRCMIVRAPLNAHVRLPSTLLLASAAGAPHCNILLSSPPAQTPETPLARQQEAAVARLIATTGLGLPFASGGPERRSVTSPRAASSPKMESSVRPRDGGCARDACGRGCQARLKKTRVLGTAATARGSRGQLEFCRARSRSIHNRCTLKRAVFLLSWGGGGRSLQI
jgi:hypothetical protein